MKKRLMSIILLAALTTSLRTMTNTYIANASAVSSNFIQFNGVSHDPTEVFNDSGRFMITYGMLDKRYDEITWPGTHNSFANDYDGTGFINGIGENQGLSVYDQLSKGARYIELDIDLALNCVHKSFTNGISDMNTILTSVKTYAERNPNQIITLRISDLNNISASNEYERVNGRLEDTGLDKFIYNWNPEEAKNSPNRCYIPDEWPTLREMIKEKKNVIFIHSREYLLHNIVDHNYYKGLNFSNESAHSGWKASQIEDMSSMYMSWEPNKNERQQNSSGRLFVVECMPERTFSGSPKVATTNNDGKKLYQQIKAWDNKLPNDRIVNFVNVDYFESADGNPSINAVDACNRVNFERLGENWNEYESSKYYWKLEPREGESNVVDILKNIQPIQNEINTARSEAESRTSSAENYLEDAYNYGYVRADSVQKTYDYTRAPEFAIDGDYNTRWTAANTNDGHVWGIDLGKEYTIDDIYIQFEYPHKKPAFKVYAAKNSFENSSNNEFRLSDKHLEKDKTPEEYTYIGGYGLDENTNNWWTKVSFNNEKYRYIKISLVDARKDCRWPAISEIKIYGPSEK